MTAEDRNKQAPPGESSVQPEALDGCDRRVQPWKVTWPQPRKDEASKSVDYEYDNDREGRTVLYSKSRVMTAKYRDERAPPEESNVQLEELDGCDRRVQPWKATWPQQRKHEGLKPVDHEYDNDLKGITVLCGRGGFNDKFRGAIFDLDDMPDTKMEHGMENTKKEPTAHAS
jgi:hypothetical protein